MVAGRRPRGVGTGAVGHRRAHSPRRGAAARRSPRRGSGVFGGGPGAAAGREGGRGVSPCGSGARPAARRRGGHPVAPWACWRAGSAEPRRRAHHRRAGQPGRLGPACALRSGADAGPAKLGFGVYGRPPGGRIGRQPGARHRRAGRRRGDDSVGPDGVDGGGGAARPLRRGAGPRPAGRRPGCRLARHQIAAAAAEVSSSASRCSIATLSARREPCSGRLWTTSSARGGGCRRR